MRPKPVQPAPLHPTTAPGLGSTMDMARTDLEGGIVSTPGRKRFLDFGIDIPSKRISKRVVEGSPEGPPEGSSEGSHS